MTILPKKKPSQQKSEGETTENANHQSHSYLAVSERHTGHSLQNHPQESRERFNFSARNSPPAWPSLQGQREEKRPAQKQANFDESGPSHSKRRHRVSPHRNLRKSHSHLRTGGGNSPNYNTSHPSTSQSAHHVPAQDAQTLDPLTQKPAEDEETAGYNSGDEYDRPFESWTEEEIQEREVVFEKMLRKKGLSIKKMGEDGACLFRAVADQIYGDQEMHKMLRKLCMDYMEKNSDYFSQYVTEDFEKYIERKRCDHIHGNHVEMQAMSEMFNRSIEVYHYSTEPINTFCGSQQNTDNDPIRLSYHRNVHYNSIIDPYKATVGVGLGLPAFKPGLADKNLMKDGIRASENLILEQAMLEDKLKATDWEATNEVIEEQVARESYLQWLRENELRNRKTSRSATATSSSSLADAAAGGMSPQSVGRVSPRVRSGGSSPKAETQAQTSDAPAEKANASPQPHSSGFSCSSAKAEVPSRNETSSPAFFLDETASFMNQIPPDMLGLSEEWEDANILAQVLAQSQQEYLDRLRRTASKDSDASAS